MAGARPAPDARTRSALRSHRRHAGARRRAERAPAGGVPGERTRLAGKVADHRRVRSPCCSSDPRSVAARASWGGPARRGPVEPGDEQRRLSL